ncbi:hypothetical protein BAUCODRAFT_57572, partial [Baudoinia panamericana UAMH 10762]
PQRTYHTDQTSQYVLPNDAPEHDRLEVQARVLSGVMNGNIIHAPVHAPAVRRVLDVGCGTGPVTGYLGRKYPHADVVGLDISVVPQCRAWPPNVRFLQGNVLTMSPIRGLDFNCGRRAQQWMRDAGFDNVKAHPYRCNQGGAWETDQAWRAFGEYVATAMVEVIGLIMRKLLPAQPGATEEVLEQMV